MSKQKGKKPRNNSKSIKEKRIDSVSKLSTRSPKVANAMKQKYIQKLKDSPKDGEKRREEATGQAIEQVQDSGRWATGELASATGRMSRQGREYAKKKAAKQDVSVPPPDDLTEPQPYISPEGTPLTDFWQEHYIHQSSPLRGASPIAIDESISGRTLPMTSPKGPKSKKQSMATNEPKERLPKKQEPVPPLAEKHQQHRNMVKPLKERPTDFKIKERSLAAAPKEPDPSPGLVSILKRNKASPGESILRKEKGSPMIRDAEIHGEPSEAISPGLSVRKPKTAVPLERRHLLLEKQKSSPYSRQSNVPFSPPDVLFPSEFPSPAPPSIPISPPRSSFQQAPGDTSMKNVFLDRTKKAFKERPHFSQKNAGTTSKPARTLKTRRTNSNDKSTIKPNKQGHPTAAQRATGAARRQVQRKMLEHPKRAVRGSIEALRRIVQVTAKTVSTVTSAVSVLIGGGILLTALVVVIVIAAVANSPFGLFYAQEPNAPGTVSVSQAVGTVKEAYNAKLEELQTGDYDSIDIQGQAPDWTEVLAVFAVKLAGADIGGLDVATLDPDRVSKLTAVFWDMTAITTEVETIDHPASDNREAWTERILHITITPKTADDMRTVYNFTPYQNSALDELLGDRPTLSSLAGSLDITGADERGVLAALPADLEQARRETVENALSLVGKVNYFWGGKSHAIGWDSRWGTLQKVTAAGSPSTGTYRPFGLDCSGMIDWALRNAGLPSDGNWYIGVNLTRVSASEARPGDMALFPDASHIGLVVGRNDAGKLLVCHCSSGRNNVVVTEFSATGFTVVGRPNIFG